MAVKELRAARIPEADIGLVSNNVDGVDPDGDAATDATTDAGAGAGVGAAVGGIGGLLTGLGVMAIPGVGPVVAAGWLAATVAGAATGAVVGGVAGGLVGALTDRGVEKDEAQVYAEGIRRGGSLVTATVDDDNAETARAILQRGSVDVRTREQTYRNEGWSGFVEDAPIYTSDQVRAERDRYSRSDGL
ncbi:hypothetical protein [Labrys sp. LIt4]|nr:hypothetical protein [Labrys sp. LIt4]